MTVIRRKDSTKKVLKEGEYQGNNGSYEFKWTDKKGKRHSLYAKTLDELRQKEDVVKKDILDGIKLEAKTLTVNDIYEKWVQVKRGLKDNTFSNYKYMYEQYVYGVIGAWKLEDIKKSDIRAFYNTLNESYGLKTSTIDSIHTVLHQVFQLAFEDDYIRCNPSDGALTELKRSVSDKTKRAALTLEQQNAFLNYLKGGNPIYGHWYPFFCVMAWTGMRIGECAGLRWDDVDFEKNVIDINHNILYYDHRTGKNPSTDYKGLHCSVGQNKTSTANHCGFDAHDSAKTEEGNRIVPMLPVVREAFLIEKAYQEEAGLKSEISIGKYTNFIFFNRFGMPHHQGTINKALKRIVRDYNYYAMDNDLPLLPLFSSHILRHSFATRLNEADINMKTRQALLGHKDIQTTLNIYTDATEDKNVSEVLKMSKVFEKSSPTTAYDNFTTNTQ